MSGKELRAKGPLPEVLTRYGVPSAASLAALHDEQRRRMVEDATLRARFEERVAHFSRFLVDRGRP